MSQSITTNNNAEVALLKVALDDVFCELYKRDPSLRHIKPYIESLPLERISIIPPIDQVMSELNKSFAVVSLDGQTVILQEITTQDGHIELVFRKQADFNLLLRNYHVLDHSGMITTAAHAWLNHPERRQFNRVVFEPSGAQEGDYNLYQGLGVIPKKGDCSLLRNHILEIICNGDQLIFDYLERWVADILQYPSNLPGIAVVLRGAEGVGKGIFGNAILRLTAPHSVHVIQANQILGRFNGLLMGVLYAFLDESFWAGDKQFESSLKGLITERELTVEHKGKEAIKVSNYARFLMASNSDWVVPAGHGARRFLVLDVSDKRKGDFVYFKELKEHINNGGLEAWAHHLLKLDLTDFELRNVPKTKALFEQKVESFNSMQRFIYEILLEASNCAGANGIDWAREVPKGAFYQSYLIKAGEIGERRRGDQIKFSNTLKLILGIHEDRTSIKGQRERVWVFPSVDICRERFAKYMDADIAWPQIKDLKLSDKIPHKLTTRY
jgi:Family of unknown function (DUF5906)